MDALHTAIRTLTAFDSLAQLKAHVAAGGKAPSFHATKVAGVALAGALLPHGIVCTLWE